MSDARKARARARGSTEAPAEFKSFGRVLRDLLIEREITTGMGNPNWSAFAELLPDVHYETLRKAVTGERKLTPGVMEAVAKALDLDPAETFDEYRLWQAQRMFDPREVGSEEALKNLARWSELQNQRS
jgi:hypothetical protein